MVELLSPAGDIECFKAAISAGADAIYVGGDKFGARAYAKNFTKEEMLEALDLAHLMHKKVYMTINTLIKENELLGLTEFLIPYYEAGLDGVIVQDLGALRVMRKEFPDLPMHASTQMTITGIYGANLLKDYGVTRVVPARELSLKEIITLKKETGLEIETFIHGAMCYAYSGQCLFSSMLGQRSGNRGRCAGPCRLPYQTCLNGEVLNDKNKLYQLSLKDLCVLEILPQLVDAGIDSFKIEGRMKSPEYVSFVTGMYRKYIDSYESDPDSYCVTNEDMDALRSKFSRGSVQSGYYHMHNGPELVTLEKPGYQSFALENNESDNLIKNGLKSINKIHVKGTFFASNQNAMTFTITDGVKSVTINGNVPAKAKNQPASIDDVYKQLNKTGNTEFIFDEIIVNMSSDLFLPNKELNEIRRQALEQFKLILIKDTKRVYENKHDLRTTQGYKKKLEEKTAKERLLKKDRPFQISLQSLVQLYDIQLNELVGRIYLSYDCFEEIAKLKDKSQAVLKCEDLHKHNIEIYLQFPAVARQKTVQIMKQNIKLVKDLEFDGYASNNLETLAFIRKHFPNKPCISESRMYLFQSEAAAFYREHNVYEHILSYELHKKEIEALISDTIDMGNSYVLPVYGYIPVMESAGCILKTNKNCKKGNESDLYLSDRHNKRLKVIKHCSRCENTIFNAVVLSLHKEMEWIFTLPLTGVLLSFTTETSEEILRIMTYYESLCKSLLNQNMNDYKQIIREFPIKEFTKGHFLKGVE